MTGLTLSLDPARFERLPSPIAYRARLLARETQLHGVHTTPDELGDLIEATFDHLFRLWVAEFAHASAPDPEMASRLVSSLGGKLLLGQRVGIARGLREVFVKQNLRTVVEGLIEVDFGRPGDREHRVSKLVDFRNTFAHGSFGAKVKTIVQHRALLEGVLEDLPALADQPVLALLETNQLVAMRGMMEPYSGAAVDPPAPLAPFLVERGGSSRLDLFPIWRAGVGHEGEWTLLPPDPAVTGQSVEAFFQREALRGYAERYAAESVGDFNHTEKLRERASRVLDTDELASLRKAVAEEHFVLVEARPGCGKAAALCALLDAEGFADVAPVVLEADELAQSAFTFVGFVLRSIERALQLPLRALDKETGAGKAPSKDKKRPSEWARKGADALKKASKHVLILIDDAPVGTLLGWGQIETVADVVRALEKSNVKVVATAHPGALVRPFPHDRKITLSRSVTPVQGDVDDFVREILTERALHRRVLETLVARGTPTTLFALCDALEAETGETMFEPAVERALADLKPVLDVHRPAHGGEQEWQLFHSAVGVALQQSGGAK